MQLSIPFRRKPASSETVDVEEVVEPAGGSTATRVRARTQSKRELGKSTPKRRQGGRPVEPAPANRREATKRMREKQREARAEARAGMLAGKEEFLPARDKGPERALVRDIVDSRRNMATYFLPGALIVILGSSGAMPPSVQVGANLFWMLLAVAVILDSVLLSRRIKKVMTKRFPKSALPPRKHYFYAIMRTFQFRRLRLPGPKVKMGETV